MASDNMLDEFALSVASKIYMFYTPILVLIGCTGNILTVSVFQKPKFKSWASNQYLSSLAISDTVFLLQLVPPWLSAMSITNAFVQPGLCQFFMYVSYASSGASAWLVVTFTLERLLAVRFPLLRTALCTAGRARLAAALVAGAALLASTPVLKYVVARDGECTIDRDYIQSATYFNITDTVLSFTVPMVVIVVGNLCIGLGISRKNHARPRHAGDSAAHRKVTRVLLTVSWTYFACNLPAYGFRLFAYQLPQGLNYLFKFESTGEIRGRLIAFQQIAVLLFHTSFAINFCLYCLTGKKFRETFCNLLSCKPKELPLPPVEHPIKRLPSPHPAVLFQVVGKKAVNVATTELPTHPDSDNQVEIQLDRRNPETDPSTSLGAVTPWSCSSDCLRSPSPGQKAVNVATTKLPTRRDRDNQVQLRCNCRHLHSDLSFSPDVITPWSCSSSSPETYNSHARTQRPPALQNISPVRAPRRYPARRPDTLPLRHICLPAFTRDMAV